MKYIKRYSTQNDYIGDYLTLRELPTHVSLVDDTDSMIGGDSQKKTVFMRGKSYNAWVGDILCWNTNTEDWEIVNSKNMLNSVGY
jgi:hypothetical protein